MIHVALTLSNVHAANARAAKLLSAGDPRGQRLHDAAESVYSWLITVLRHKTAEPPPALLPYIAIINATPRTQ